MIMLTRIWELIMNPIDTDNSLYYFDIIIIFVHNSGSSL